MCQIQVKIGVKTLRRWRIYVGPIKQPFVPANNCGKVEFGHYFVDEHLWKLRNVIEQIFNTVNANCVPHVLAVATVVRPQ
jgi:hypothetical protein